MNRGKLRWAFVLVVAFAFSGCSETPPPPVAEAAESEATDFEITLDSVSFEEWKTELESMKGEIVVVDLWATWCVPCIERFPKMVAMSRTYEEQGVRFVSLSLDDRDDEDTIPQVTEFLREQNATMPNYLMDEIIPDAFEKLDLLGVPAVFVYDAEGELRYRLTGDNPNDQFTEEDVEDAIRELLDI